MGQPIVETTNDALSTFFGCGLDYLYIGDYLVKKRLNYLNRFRLFFKKL